MGTSHSKKLKRELDFYKSQALLCYEKIVALIHMLGQELHWSSEQREEVFSLLKNSLAQQYNKEDQEKP